ncbi:glycosyltransferase family 61 protein [Pedobacter insulae]|nr:glycosyltransferase family 61 protein [Pedobacter insulae]
MKKMIRIYRRDKVELLKPLVKYITAKWFFERYFIPINKYALIHPTKVTFIRARKITLSYNSIQFFNSIVDTELKHAEGTEYVVKLNDVKIIGRSDVIILDEKHVLYDIKFLDTRNEFEYSDSAIRYYKDDKCVLVADYAKESFDKGLIFVGNYSSNYYHMLLEIMVKFRTLDTLNLDKDIPLIMDEAFMIIPQCVEILSYLNTDNRKIITVTENQAYTIGEAFHISCPNIIPPNYKNITKINASSAMFDLSSIAYLRKLLEKGKPINFPKRIFISRKNASGRRGYNEDEIYARLEKYGFKLYFPEDHAMSEQISIFNNAELIIGATGAAFTNILFCNDQCKVVCLTNYKLNLSIFSTIAKYVGVEMIYLFDKDLILNEDSDLHEPFTIDLHEIDQTIALLT